MKVLWLMNWPLPDLSAYLGIPQKPGGSWTTALSREIVLNGKIELGVASIVQQGKNIGVSIGGIQHFTVLAPRTRYGLLRPSKSMIRRYKEIVTQFSPDVIHVHGTEWHAGIITKNNSLGPPTVISIQGLIDFYRRYLLGDLSFLDVLNSRTLKEWLLFRGLWELKLRWNKKAAIEREIIKGNNIFIGRTLWDKAHVRRLNPNSIYYHCDELVRSEFYNRRWDISTASIHTIFAPSASYPLKGFHLLVRAVAILKRDFPDIKVRVPLAGFTNVTGLKGVLKNLRKDGYANYLSKLIKKLELEENIIALGHLTADQMVQEMQQAFVFVQTSFVENSSLALAEALTIGVPAVVSLAGGTTSMIIEGRSVLGYPPGDEAVLAEQIRQIFIDHKLAARLSKAGKEIASQRHSNRRIIPQMIDIYESAAIVVNSEKLKKTA